MSCCKNIGVNTGVGCVDLFNRTKKIWLIPTRDSQGNRNSIDATSALDDAYFLTLTENADLSKRLSPVPQLEDVEITTGDSSTVTSAGTGRVAFLNKGAIAFTGNGWFTDGHTPALFKELDKEVRCNQYSIFIVDLDGNVIGEEISGDQTQLFPIKLDKGSWNIVPVYQGSDNSKLVYNFNFSTDTDYGNLSMISFDELSIT